MTPREEALTARVDELEQEVARLRETESMRRAINAQAVAGVSSLAWKVVAGIRLNSALETIFVRLEAKEPPTPKELAEVVAALIRRFVRVGLVALVVAVIPGIVAIAQTSLLANQNRILINTQREDLLYARLAALASADGTMLRMKDGLKKFEFQHEVLGKPASDILGYAFGDAEGWAMLIERNIQLLVFYEYIHADLHWAAIQSRNLPTLEGMDDGLIEEVVTTVHDKMRTASDASKREQEIGRAELVSIE